MESYLENFHELFKAYTNASPSFSSTKDSILGIHSEVQKNLFYSETNEENELRPKFVGFQSVSEQVITRLVIEGAIESVIGIIHTMLPATPVCTESETPEELIHESSRENPEIVDTVRLRAIVIREFLNTSSKLFIVYHRDSRNQRTEKQLSVFEELTVKYNGFLIDFPVDSPVPDELSGATYLFKVRDQEFMFGINARQALNPSGTKEWKLFLGRTSEEPVQSQYQRILRFLEDQGLDINK